MLVAVHGVVCERLGLHRVAAGGRPVSGDAPATFGERVRQLREDQGLTRGELAERINTTGAAIYQWEIGRTHPHHDTYPRLASALQTTIDYLMTGRAS